MVRFVVLVLLVFLLGTQSVLAEDAADIERRKADLILKLKVHRAIDRGAIWVGVSSS